MRNSQLLWDTTVYCKPCPLVDQLTNGKKKISKQSERNSTATDHCLISRQGRQFVRQECQDWSHSEPCDVAALDTWNSPTWTRQNPQDCETGFSDLQSPGSLASAACTEQHGTLTYCLPATPTDLAAVNLILHIKVISVATNYSTSKTTSLSCL